MDGCKTTVHAQPVALLGNKIKEILKSPAAISQLPRKLYDKLQAGGFIVEDGVNELELVINENTKAINKKIIRDNIVIYA